jgi:acyl-coenzyme A synthetase/AMP-(fatty) acid ligase
MARTVVGDHERFKQAYFTTYPGYYFTGDGAYRLIIFGKIFLFHILSRI